MEQQLDKETLAILKSIQEHADIGWTGLYVNLPGTCGIDQLFDDSFRPRFGTMEHWIKLSTTYVLMPGKHLLLRRI